MQNTGHAGIALRQKPIKAIQPISPTAPTLSANLNTDFSLYQSPLRAAFPKKSEAVLGETDKQNRAALLNQQDEIILDAEKPNPKVPTADPKAHLSFFIASAISAMLSLVFYVVLINTVASSPASLFLTSFAFFGFYIGIILFSVALLIGLILYVIYRNKKG